ncbi:hypothetical protein GA0074695_6173 [Micromonospora viridifaciens]|uniref:PPE family protein n=1 Tax=Micromonospora viridifaciens TaxID=1881 RepID=A0A1C4ZV60_MICVI|nr:hypothetical protein GA0074695_6173 [Micromonospora viridifaciens]
MWACLQEQETAGQWKQVAGWRKICDLALAHLSRLREYRRGLAEAWPPETNAAARAYLGELDQLIDKVQRTHDAAAANYDALAAATRAISSTRADLKPIYDEYAAKLQQKRAYEATLADPKAVAGSRLPDQPPVTDADLEQLNVRARGLMTGLSGELQQAQVMLRQPPTLRPRIDDGEPYAYGPPTSQVPTIPPVVPVPVPLASAPHAAQPAARTPSVSAQPGSTAGPILGGSGAGVLAPSTPSPSPSPSPSLSPHTALPPSAPSAPGVGQPPSLPPLAGRALGRNGANGPRGESQSGRSPNGIPNGSGPGTPSRGMPPGGLIGGTGMGFNQPASPAPPRRVNPIGGVIGGGSAGTAPSGGAGSRPGGGRSPLVSGLPGATPLGGHPNPGIPSHRSSDHRCENDIGHRPWDPEHPWETSQGVAPVMLPPGDDGPIDPGPAIGIDK